MSSVEIKEELKESAEFQLEPSTIIAAVALFLAFVLSYVMVFDGVFPYLHYIHGNTFESIFWQWRTPDYQHGFFVLPFCAFLLWYRRDMMTSVPTKGSWWGLALFAVWAALRLFGAYYKFAYPHNISIVPGVAAIVLFIGGWQAIRWSWPALVFMGFMIPLPGYLMNNVLSYYLQAIGCKCSVYLIQLLGIPSLRSGNNIQISGMPNPLNVAEACSGIRMLMLFFAICVAAAFVMKNREPSDRLQESVGGIPIVGPFLALILANWERWLIVLSSIPIAIAANVLRLSLIAIFTKMILTWPNYLLSAEMLEKWPNNVTETWAHDVPGLMMMPIGLLLLWLEWAIISKLFIEEPITGAASMRKAQVLLPMGNPTRKVNPFSIKPADAPHVDERHP